MEQGMWEQGEAYEGYVGRWSRVVAREFVAWLGVPEGGRWLDVGCGTGALSETVLAVAAPAEVVGIDASEGYVAHARERVRDERVAFRTGDAQALPFEAGAFDAAVSGLMLNSLPEPRRGLAEMARVTGNGGTVAVYVWDYAGEMQLMRRFWDAAVALDPAAVALDEGRRFSLCDPRELEGLFGEVGLGEVATRAIDVPTVFRDFEDYWGPFMGAQGPAPSYVASLSEERRDVLRERLRETLPTEADGSIRLVARAWAATGRR